MDLRAKAEELYANDAKTPPAKLHEEARQLFLKVVRVGGSSLTSLIVDVACLAALTGYTAGQRNAGFTFASIAESRAENSGQPELIARAAGMKRLHYSAEVGIGSPHESVAWGRRAADTAEPGVMRAWALANLAPELAVLKERKECFHVLNAADRQWGQGWGYGLFSVDGYLKTYRSPGPIIGLTGRCLALLGDGNAAITELTSAMRLPSSRNLTTVWYVDSVLAYLAIGDCAQTCGAAMTALEACEEIGYGLGIQRVKNIRARFPSSWEGTAYVRALDDYLALR